MVKCFRHGTHYLVAHLDYFNTRLPCFKMIRDLIYLIYHKSINTHVYLCLRLGEVKIFLEVVIFVSDNFKTTIRYFHNFSVSFFLSLGTHESHHLDGCQAIGRSSSFIFAFWGLRLFNLSLILWSFPSARACLLRSSSPLPATPPKKKSVPIRDNKNISSSYMFI